MGGRGHLGPRYDVRGHPQIPLAPLRVPGGKPLILALLAAMLSGTCEGDGHIVINGADFFRDATRNRPPRATYVPFPDRTMKVGATLVLLDAHALFYDRQPPVFSALSSDTLVVRAGIHEDNPSALVLEAVSPGRAVVYLIATEPPPHLSFGESHEQPQGLSAIRRMNVTVIQ
ncbi:MAG: hypothetical protein OXQ29_21345 [Rhodospirillaceae bacterium]|nr:hypothetical protein [Rhodospirillaceae bacterium]